MKTEPFVISEKDGPHISHFLGGKSMNSEEIKSRIADFNWFHAIRLAEGVVSPGRFPKNIPPNWTLFPVFHLLEGINLSGMDCIDIGATDGLVSFIVKSEGASCVVATDRATRATFPFCREILGLDVKYFPQTTLDNGDLLKKLQHAQLPEKYDLVILAGVIYHSYDPLVVMMHARNLLKPNGLLIVESTTAPGNENALFMNWEMEKPMLEPNTYFQPTLKALDGLLRFCSCSCLTSIRNKDRGAVLGRACRPSEISGCSDMLKDIIERGSCYGPLSYKELESGENQGPSSSIDYTGPISEIEIDIQTFSTRFSLQPEAVR